MPTIKVKGGFRRFPPQTVLTTSLYVDSKIYGNDNFTPPQAPAPPVDQATLGAANDRLAAAIARAMDRSRQGIAEQSTAKEVVVKLLEQVATYAQTNCKDDPLILIGSGFTQISTTRTMTPPVSESIRKLVHGENSGEMAVTLMTYPGAASYEFRWGIALAGGALPENWTMRPIVKLRPATMISGLTPGATYMFQARAVVEKGYSDWGNPITRIVL